jgi:hypothetical protein
MPNYDVFVFCDHCGQPHPGYIRISLPIEVEQDAIGNIYKGIDLDPQVVNLINNQYMCPETGKPLTQRNNDQVFLVRVPDEPPA